jgi:hypothetical protein
MKTWMLIIFLAYSNGGPGEGGGSVALQSEKVDFFSPEECLAAQAAITRAIRASGFNRSVAICVARGVSLLERSDPITNDTPALK